MIYAYYLTLFDGKNNVMVNRFKYKPNGGLVKLMIVYMLLMCFPLSMIAQTQILLLPNDNDTIAEIDTISAESLDVNVDSASVFEIEGIVKGFEDGYSDGKADGREAIELFWLGAGCGGGLYFVLPGVFIWYEAKRFPDDPPYIPIIGNFEYQSGYLEGYRSATKSKKASNACIGGCIGSALFPIWVLLAFGYGLSHAEGL